MKTRNKTLNYKNRIFYFSCILISGYTRYGISIVFVFFFFYFAIVLPVAAFKQIDFFTKDRDVWRTANFLFLGEVCQKIQHSVTTKS